ncbi:hypothetical protein BDV97DRAFT_397687 [Delphinella strobiligena]|nr:hypothetical protein BDV97DRAFT_397687 [Delphinella strobiligena]
MYGLKTLSVLALSSLAMAMPTSEPASGLQIRSMSSTAMVANINNITQQSTDLTTIVRNLSTNDSLRRRSTTYEQVIDGFQGIITTAQNDIIAMDGTAAYTDTTAEQDVCDAFHNFVIVHQNLLSLLIGKSGLLESVFLGPIASVLLSLESVVDTLAFGIIDAVPFCANTATNDKNNLDDTLGKAICAYTPGGTLGVDLFC